MRRLPHAVSLFLLAIVASCADATRPIAPAPASSASDAAVAVAEPTEGAPASLVSTTTLTARTVPPGSGAQAAFREAYSTDGEGTARYTNLDPSLYTQLIWAPTEVSIGFGADPMQSIPLDWAGWPTYYRGDVPIRLASGPSSIGVIVRLEVRDGATGLYLTSTRDFAAWGLPELTGAAWQVNRSQFEMEAKLLGSHPLIDGGERMMLHTLVQRLRDHGLLDPMKVTIHSQFFYAANPCPAGQWGDGFNCGVTPAGSYAVVGAEQPSPCAAGRYQPMPGQVACLAAPAGTFVNAPGAIAASACAIGSYQPNVGQISCLAAPPGRFVNTIGAASAIPCAAGTYQPATGASACLVAPAGSFVDVPGAITPTPCPAARYQPNIGQIACVVTDPGYFVASEGAIAQVACPVGTFTATQASAACTPAPAGSYVNIIAATKALPCAAGTFQPAVGSAACLASPPGSFVDIPGAIAATNCAAGRYQPNAGQIACFVADRGHYVADVGAIAQLPCAAGTFAAAQAAIACTVSPAGHYVNVVAATSATPCAVGSFQPQVGQIACFLAAPGTYVAVTAAVQATPCAAGSYNPLVGASSASACLPAPAGTYVSVPGAAAATPCAPGSYNIVPGSISCTLAEIGRYVPTAGAIASIPCPAGYTTLQVGSTSCLAMVAQSITFTSTPPSPAYEEGSYQLSATGGASGNAVTFSTTSSACSVSGNVVRLRAPGSCTIEAHQAGGGLYYAAPTATQSFLVVALPADARTTGMITQLQSLAGSGTVAASDAQSLTSLLQAAVQAFTRGSTQAGVNQLNAFINRVEAMERSRRVSSATASALIAAARKAIAAA